MSTAHKQVYNCEHAIRRRSTCACDRDCIALNLYVLPGVRLIRFASGLHASLNLLSQGHIVSA